MNPHYIEMARLLWPRAKSILLPWDGAATELFVTALPLDTFHRAFERIASSVQEPQLVATPSEEIPVPIALTTEFISRFNRPENDDIGNYAVCGSLSADRDISFYLWIDNQKKLFEVEMVFWNDISFAKTNAESQQIDMFARLLELAEKLRHGVNSSKCILAPEHNGPTEALLDNERAIVW